MQSKHCKKGNPSDFFAHIKGIQSLFSGPCDLHVQVYSNDAEMMVEQAKHMVHQLGDKVFIKIPANEPGYQAMQQCKALGFRVTATAIYSYIQAVLSLEAGADVLAPYVNRIEANQGDPFQLISQMHELMISDYPSSRIVAASFKRVDQIEQAIQAKASQVTLSKAMFDAMGYNEHVEAAIERFLTDWDVYTTANPLK